jgi:C1A family cysteine protease
MYEFLLIKFKKVGFTPSRLFIYWHERVVEGLPTWEDTGAELKDGIKTLATLGVCTETTWPYETHKFSTCPPRHAFSEAYHHKVVKYEKLDNKNLTQLKACLASGFPFVCGFTVYNSFESSEVAKTGIVPMPASSEKIVGGHAVMVVGYDDDLGVFIVRNSWGIDWGMKGYFTIPYAYFTNISLATDFWTSTLITG